ncbi:MAG: type I pullulanase [Acholeplasmataceae bacterium]|jgi:pullulanase|nr:type I pullulanase [Acholeplasmataceae bacterium]
MKIFIDDFQLLRVESYDYIYEINIDGYHITWLRNENGNQFFKVNKPLALHQCDKILVNGQGYPLEIGVITLNDAFDEAFRYDGRLGYEYSPTETTFRLFTPVAKEVFVVVNNESYPMQYKQPIWTCTVKGDLHEACYHYSVRLVDVFNDVKDPYSHAESSLGSHVVDFNRVKKVNPSPIKLSKYVDAVIYEGHVRDLTINLDVKHRGLYDGLIERSDILHGSVIEYIKKLGMTHLQLLPIFDFDDVFDNQKKLKYNWGYNPANYFAVEGWYAKDPDNPIDRIESLRSVINEAHQIGLGINMDVVYNHVYDNKTFPFDHLVPGYFYRHDPMHKMTNGSYCGNDVESRRYMVRKLIVDSLIHWVEHFQIDGFRFDLMGLLDLKTMLRIENELKAINPSIMLYGEGWNMPTEVHQDERSNMNNYMKFPHFAHFNDFYRNTMKGELHGPSIGFTHGNHHLISKAMKGIIGSPHMFSSPNQSINYVECHDNLTYYDKMLITNLKEPKYFNIYQDFANHLIAISQGIPFYHAGQEFYRSKKGVENSYNHPDDINQISWNPDLLPVQKLKEILKIRKKYSLYRQKTYHKDIAIHHEKNLIIYTLKNKKMRLEHYIKYNFSPQNIALNDGQVIFTSQPIHVNKSNIIINQPGVYIIHYHQ